MKRINKVIVVSVIVLLASGLTYILMKNTTGAAETEPFVNPHGNYNVSETVYGTPKCAKCHSGHSAYGLSLLRYSSIKETCYTCHGGGNSVPDVKGQFGETTIGSSVYASYHPVPTNGQVCTTCHDPHLATEQTAGGTASLLAVGSSKVSSGNAVCGVCHGAGSILPGGDMLAGFVYTAHDTSMNGPSSGTQIKCARCHQPHGSPYNYLLRTSIEDQNGVPHPVTGNNNTLCFACHTAGTGNYSGQAIFSAVSHGSKTTSSVALTVYPGISYSPTMCMNCHEPHGKTGIADYKRADSKTLCITCHDDPGTTKPDTFSYRGISAYNSTPHGSSEPTPNMFKYNLGSSESAAWSTYGNIDPTPSSPGTAATADQIGNATVSDCVYWTTDGTVVDGAYNYQLYKFHLSQSVVNIRKMDAKWTGYAEPTPGYFTDLFIWNKTTGTWQNLVSQVIGSRGTLAGSVTSNFGDYITAENDVYVLVRAKHDNTAPVVSAGWGPQFNTTSPWADIVWTTDENANSIVDYGTTPSYGSQAGSADSYTQAHSVRLSGLVAGQTYYYRITTADKVGNTTIKTGTFVARCASPVPHAVAYQSQDTNWVFYENFAWDGVPDPGGNTVRYDVQISLYSDFRDYTSHNSLTDSTATSWTTTVTQPGGYYTQTWWWRVRAKDAYGGVSDWAVGSFQTNVYSCPILYTWDGSKYQFITDIVSGSNVGLELAPHKYVVPTPYEQVVIPWNMLAEKDGKYIIKIKNEQNEVDFVDNLVLEAVDHPIGTRIALNDFKRTFEPYRVYTYSADVKPVKKATYVNNPTWSGGKPTAPVDITESVSKVDGKYAIGQLWDDNRFAFDLGDVSGAREIKLVVVGWNDYANADERVQRIEKAKKGFKMAPWLLDVLQPDGSWKSEQIKYIPGYTKTMVIDLTGKFPKGTRKYMVRLRGLYRPHLDFVGVDTTPQADIRITALELKSATLGYDQPSAYIKYPSPQFFYDQKRNYNLWTHDGKFTRYGDVMPLVTEIDDRLVVMDTGDELTAAFKALPPPAPGMLRSFVLKPWAYYKELSQAKVEPMPFRKMNFSNYPKSLGDYPKELKKYVQEWNTRVHHAGDKALNPSVWDKIGMFFNRLFRWIAEAWHRLFDSASKGSDRLAGASQDAQSKRESHYSLNTDCIELQVLAIDPLTPAGDCGICHAVHGSDSGSGTPITKQLKLAPDNVCFGGGFGCHSDANNSAQKINIKDRFTIGPDRTAHHSISPAEQAAGGTKVQCVNCHNPHLNTPANKLVDPTKRQNTFESFLNSSTIPNYINNNREVYVLVYANVYQTTPLRTDYVMMMTNTIYNTGRYEIGSAGTGAWYGSGEKPDPVNGPGTPIADADKSRIQFLDNNYWDSAVPDTYNYQVYKFTLNAPGADIRTLALSWSGYNIAKPGYDIELYMWNFSNSSWGSPIATKNWGVRGTFNNFNQADYINYCLKCHDNTAPPAMPGDVKMGSAIRIDTAFPNDRHGAAAGPADYIMAWDWGAWGAYPGGRGDSSANIILPYQRNNPAISCVDCHDPHGSLNTYHLRENTNGKVGSADTTAYCQSCHTDTAEQWHQPCLQCHRATETTYHGAVMGTPASRLSDFGRACTECHQHGKKWVHPVDGGCDYGPDHCGTGYNEITTF